MTDRCQAYTNPPAHRCKNKVTCPAVMCAKHESGTVSAAAAPAAPAASACAAAVTTITLPADLLQAVKKVPGMPPSDGPLPLPAQRSGEYTIKTLMYERYETEFKGGEFAGKTKWVYNYPMAANTVDLVVFDPTLTQVLLVQRGAGTKPLIYAEKYAVPGGFMEGDENATTAAIREFNEEVSPNIHVDEASLYHVYTATIPNRDVRQRTISIVFTTILPIADVKGNPVDKDEIRKWKWFSVAEVLKMKDLSFDHVNLVARALATQKIMKQLDPTARKLLQMTSTDISNANINYRREGKGKN